MATVATRWKQFAQAATMTNTVVWEPMPGNQPQLDAYHCKADRLFYGGGAGGGKSDLLLGYAITKAHTSIIFRREHTQLFTLIERAEEIIGSVGSVNRNAGVLRLPDGRRLEFGACQHEKDTKKYQGRDHSFIGFDEITHFTRYKFEYLTAWNRSTVPGERCRIIATGNPPSELEGMWVKDYWAPWLDDCHKLFPVTPGELLWYITVGGEDIIVDGPEPVKMGSETYTPHSRTFIPARFTDNPALANTDYSQRLDALPEPLRSQMKYGIFSHKSIDDPWQVVPSAHIDRATANYEKPPSDKIKFIGVDVARGGEDTTAIAMCTKDFHFYPLLEYPGSTTPDGNSVAAQVAKHWRRDTIIYVDVVGVGSSVVDILSGTFDDVYGLGGSMAALDNRKRRLRDSTGMMEFANLRSYLYWNVRQLLESGTIKLPRNPRLKQELCAHRWKLIPPRADEIIPGRPGRSRRKVESKGRIQVLSKDDVKKLIGRSPGLSDALVYACAGMLSVKSRQHATGRAYV